MEFYQRIESLRKNKEYAKIAILIFEYLSDNNNRITASILDIYAISLINLGNINEAITIIDKIINEWPDFYTGKKLYDLVYMYIRTFQFEKAEKIIIDKTCFTPQQIFKLGKACFYNLNYDLAERLFKSLIDLVPKKSNIYTDTKRYLEKIRLYKLCQEFRPSDFSHFKYNGKTLKPGHIIGINQLRDEYIENTYNPQPLKIQKRLKYMIWKIDYENGKIYAFPIINIEKKDKIIHTIPAEHYNLLFYDRRLKDNLRVIRITDVSSVIGELTPNDYEKSIATVFESLYYMEQGKHQIHSFQFMKAITKERNAKAKVGDIIKVYDFKEKRTRRFFIFAVEEDRFKTFEINEIHQPVGNRLNIVYIGKREFHHELINLGSSEVISKLLALVPNIEYYNVTTKSLHPDISYSAKNRKKLVRKKNIPTIKPNQ